MHPSGADIPYLLVPELGVCGFSAWQLRFVDRGDSRTFERDDRSPGMTEGSRVITDCFGVGKPSCAGRFTTM